MRETRERGEAARRRLLAGAPVAGQHLEVRGTSTSLLHGGTGPPLVLLHGGIECGGAYWAPVLTALAERHRIVVPDVPGLGESAPVDGRLPEVFDAWLAELLERTCDDPPTLVAHSLVGSLSAGFAVRHGRLLDRLVVYAAPGLGPYRMPPGLPPFASRCGPLRRMPSASSGGRSTTSTVSVAGTPNGSKRSPATCAARPGDDTWAPR